MLTLQTVLEAPPTSPLAEVDINNVAELLVQLTSEHHQLQPLDSTKVIHCCYDHFKALGRIYFNFLIMLFYFNRLQFSLLLLYG